ncbi:MAG: hypothetical protein ABI880_08505 [Acidobacteriota bacterium]
MFRRSALGFGALLGGFHLWLLGNQAWSGQLSEPDLILRWTAALALAGGLVALRRRGESLVGRKAVVIWLLAALLHGPALGNDLDGFATPSLPETVATLGQLVASVSALALTLLLLVAGRLGRVAPRRTGPVAVAPSGFALDPGSGLAFLPRPPPPS